MRFVSPCNTEATGLGEAPVMMTRGEPSYVVSLFFNRAILNYLLYSN